MKRAFLGAVCAVLLLLLVEVVVFLILPLVSFNALSYDEICAKAASVYGIGSDEYVVEFKNVIETQQGNKYSGLYSGYKTVKGVRVHDIQIKNSFFKSTVIATIFHEFAHAAQTKYDLDFGDHTKEQHA